MNTMTANCKKLAIVCHDMTVNVDFFSKCFVSYKIYALLTEYRIFLDTILFRVFIDCRAFCRAYH